MDPTGIPFLPDPVRCTPAMLPNNPDEDFRHSSFFKTWTHLPSPEAVRSMARAQYLAGSSPDKRKTLGEKGPFYSPPPVVFASANLFVKWGSNVTIAEGQSLYAVHHFLEGGVPIPEDPRDPFVGSIRRGHIYDRAIGDQFTLDAGPFCSVKEFHDWFAFLCRRRMEDPYSTPMEPFRSDLPDDAEIKFTHGDLHRSNIMVKKSDSWQIIAIVDWEQSCWMPEYWEARKASFTAEWNSEWNSRYLPSILQQYESTVDAWYWYTSSTGP
ncbi:predicted protein [Uncinocarpus reesii 1704]|uniref:Aminoglycoside phosphotransferase domain-containing protein n=1 Tax=Uncinocarpus reesii (strain UAMH 1704) TaxID=336963 RepID=C4JLL3_UNCRE|nr:uncharacterized protein UREG_03721 [Uncinocarpus reesii 1704]EEP78875.1 predicted protein [Uncinocarpus reesii 1704]